MQGDSFRFEKTLATWVPAALLLLTATPGNAQLWQAGVPGEDFGSVAILGGFLQPSTTYDDGSTFASGVGSGLAVAAWPHRYIGVRSVVIRSRTEGREGDQFSPLQFQNPVVWLYDVELALRYPLVGSSLALAPYIAGGVGGKTYRWDPSWPEQTSLTVRTLTGAAGLEVRPGGRALGLIAEVRGYSYGYTGFNYQWGDGIGRHIGNPQDSTDLLFSLGLTLSR